MSGKFNSFLFYSEDATNFKFGFQLTHNEWCLYLQVYCWPLSKFFRFYKGNIYWPTLAQRGEDPTAPNLAIGLSYHNHHLFTTMR